MFCMKCGTQYQDGAAFCPSCGCASNSTSGNVAPAMDYNAQMMQAQMMQAQQYQMQKNAIRQSEIDSIKRAYDHFNLKRDTFQKYDNVGVCLNHYLRGAKSALIVWGAIITVLSCVVLFPFASYGSGRVIFIISLIIGLAMIAGGVLMKVNNKKKCRQYESEYIRLSQELNDHYNAYPMCPVGAEYSNPEIIEVIMRIMNSGRADTIRDAINVMVAEINQAEMNAYLQNIEAYSRSTAASSKTTAVFAAASFFIK